MNGLPESPSALPDPREYDAEQLKNATEEALENYPHDPGLQMLQESVDLTNSGRLEAHINERFEHQLPAQLAEISTANRQILKGPDGTGTRILTGLRSTPAIRSDVQAIIDAICTAPGEKNSLNHRYVEIQKHAGAPDWYGIKFRAVERDQKLLATLRAANPDLTAEFGDLEAALNDYAHQDPRIDVYNWERKQSGNEVDRSILHMGKAVIFLAAVAAALSTGVMSLINRKFSITPLLYIAIAGAIASPTLRQRVFSGASANMVADIDAAINPVDAKADMHKYGVAGKAWKRHAKGLMDGSPAARAFLKDMKKYGPEHIPLETVDAYVEKTMPAAGPEREELRQMILDGRYAVFAARMDGIRSADAKSAVLEYIGRGAAKLETEAVAAMQDMNEAEEHIPSGYPENGYLDGNNLYLN